MSTTKGKVKIKVVKPGGDIVASMAKEFKQELRTQIKKEPEKLIIDMASVKMIDSIGLGVIISAYNSLKEKGSKLAISNVRNDILNLLKVMRLDNLFEVKQ